MVYTCNYCIPIFGPPCIRNVISSFLCVPSVNRDKNLPFREANVIPSRILIKSTISVQEKKIF